MSADTLHALDAALQLARQPPRCQVARSLRSTPLEPVCNQPGSHKRATQAVAGGKPAALRPCHRRHRQGLAWERGHLGIGSVTLLQRLTRNFFLPSPLLQASGAAATPRSSRIPASSRLERGASTREAPRCHPKHPAGRRGQSKVHSRCGTSRIYILVLVHARQATLPLLASTFARPGSPGGRWRGGLRSLQPDQLSIVTRRTRDLPPSRLPSPRPPLDTAARRRRCGLVVAGRLIQRRIPPRRPRRDGLAEPAGGAADSAPPRGSGARGASRGQEAAADQVGRSVKVTAPGEAGRLRRQEGQVGECCLAQHSPRAMSLMLPRPRRGEHT
jgi:hypothetical protein